MAIHFVRDYLTQNVTTEFRTYISGYLLAIFARRILLYSHVGNTNYNINTIGPYLIATGDSNPSGTPAFAPGSRAGINQGPLKEFWVSIPSGIRTVSSTDIGRLLVLRSTSYPTYNSGIYLIVGIDVASNSYIIDYRTLGDYPPIEPADSMNWYLYEKDSNCPIFGNPNTKPLGSYRSDGNSNTPRIILQSPHATGWQLRICNESMYDSNGGLSFFGHGTGNCAMITAIPGFNGNSSGDFLEQGQHIHAPLWYNSNSLIYKGGACGFGDNSGAGEQYRITIIGDDTGQGISIFGRRPGNEINPKSFVGSFGLAENEPSPLPVNNAARLYCIGSGSSNSSYSGGYGNRLNDISLMVGNIDFYNHCQGMSLSTTGVPTICAPSLWAYITGGGQFTSPIFDSSASDNPFINATELLPIDLITGTLSSWSNDLPAFVLAPRLIGTIPHLRIGRANFGEFSLTTDANKSYQHMRRGIYIPWNGPNVIP
jgi:hypothetical protein